MIKMDQLKEKIINEEKFAVIIENPEIKKLDLSTIKKLKEIKTTSEKKLYISKY